MDGCVYLVLGMDEWMCLEMDEWMDARTDGCSQTWINRSVPG